MPIVEAVAIGVSRAGTFSQTPRTVALRDAMADAVKKAYADGELDPEKVRARMKAAYDAKIKELDGNLER